MKRGNLSLLFIFAHGELPAEAMQSGFRELISMKMISMVILMMT